MASITVYNYTEFVSALTTNPAIDTIYLGADITATGIIPVLRTKGSITIDGINPADPDQIIHTYTDPNSATNTHSVHLRSGSAPFTSVTVRNMIIKGRNYYGFFWIEESSLNQNVVFNIINVQYSGPQAIHHRSGLTHITDSSFIIDKLNGTVCSVEELCETNKLILEGNITIYNNCPGDACMWLCNASPYLRVMPNSTVNIDVVQTYMIYCDNALSQMSFGTGSNTLINSKYGIFLTASAAAHIASSILVDTGASLKIYQSARRSGVGTLRSQTGITVNDGATFNIFAPFTPSEKLIDFSQAATVNFNNPKSVVLYNYGNMVFHPSSTLRLNVSAELVNRWTSALPLTSAGGIDDIPQTYFRRLNGSLITSTATTNSSTTLTVTGDNSAADIGGVMTTTNYNIMNAVVLSYGTVPLELEPITDLTLMVKGTTQSNSNIRLKNGTIIYNGTADAQGGISLPISPIAPATTIRFYTNQPFLTKFVDITTEGTLRLSHTPPRIDFPRLAVPVRRQIIERTDPNAYVEVTDTRIEGGQWYLYATLTSQMHTDTDILNNALIFKTGGGIVPFSAAYILVATEISPPYSATVTRIMWPPLEGVLLELLPDYNYNGGVYNGSFNWVLSDSPL